HESRARLGHVILYDDRRLQTLDDIAHSHIVRGQLFVAVERDAHFAAACERPKLFQSVAQSGRMLARTMMAIVRKLRHASLHHVEKSRDVTSTSSCDRKDCSTD